MAAVTAPGIRMADLTIATGAANTIMEKRVAAPTATGSRLIVRRLGASYSDAGAGFVQIYEETVTVSGVQLELKDGTGAGGADQLVRSGTGSFVADGVVAGDLVFTAGFVNGNNNATWLVTLVAASTIDVTNLAGASVATNEVKAAGATAAEYAKRARVSINGALTPECQWSNPHLEAAANKALHLVMDAGGAGAVPTITAAITERSSP